MPYRSTAHEHAYSIETGEQSSQSDITIDGREYKIDWRAIAPLAADAKGQLSLGGRFSLLIAGKSYEIFARRVTKPGENSSQTFEIQFAGQLFEVQVEDEREKALAGAVASAHAAANARVRPPIPALVLRIPLET